MVPRSVIWRAGASQPSRTAGTIFLIYYVSGVTVYFIPRIFYPGDSIYYPTDSISLVYFIPRQDILSLHGVIKVCHRIFLLLPSPAVQQSSSQSVLTKQ